jgi:hypothetical protein
MTEAIYLIARYQLWLYAVLGLAGVLYLRALWRANHLLGQTLFGLEKEAALEKRNGALVMLTILGALSVSVFVIDRVVAPQLRAASATATPAARPTAAPTPTPLGAGGGPLQVDSSGCENPQATLIEPLPGARISGSFVVRGTADTDNFAFFTLEIGGLGTNGQWVPLQVGNTPVQSGDLGTLDTSVYDSGEYALRLVVKDTTGSFPPPCVIAVTIVAISLQATPLLP